MNFLRKILRFGVVGLLTAVVHYGILYLGVEWAVLNATLASSLGFAVAVFFNYLMHYYWTFVEDEPAPHGRTLGRYLVMISCGFLINGGIMQAGQTLWALHYLLVQAVALVAVVLWNFVVSNTWVFRRSAP